MNKLNCWEFKHCGRQPGGAQVTRLGQCPAATDTRVTGLHDGLNGGRVCWAITGTLCGGQVQGTFAMKLVNCMDCDFYKQVLKEEGSQYQKAGEILARLKS